MELLKYMFYLGIVYIVFSMIWGFFMLMLNLLTMGQRKGVFEEYLLRAGKYYFIVSLTSMAALLPGKLFQLPESTMTITGLAVLFLYLLGKMQQTRIQFAMQSSMFQQMRIQQRKPNAKVELAFLLGSLAFYTACTQYPEIAVNDATLWFYNSIEDIYGTVLIGWIIKILGVFFLISILFRGVMVIQMFINRLNGNIPISEPGGKGNTNQFDDFEEVADDEDQERSA